MSVNNSDNSIMQFFSYGHLSNQKLQGVSHSVYDLASLMDEGLPNGPEKSAGLRKLLEAKDCFVRAVIQGEKTLQEGQGGN